MIVRCTHCDAAYAVDDGKITNKKFGFSCPKCGTNVIIDNRLKARTAAAAERAPAGDFDSLPDLPGGYDAAGGHGKPLPSGDKLAALDDFDSASLDSGPQMKDELSTDDFGLDSVESLLSEEPAPGVEHESLEDEALKLEDFGESLEAEMKEPAGEFDDMVFADEPETGHKPAGKGTDGGAEDEIDFDSIMLEDEPPHRKSAPARRDGPHDELVDFSDELSMESEIKSDEVFSKDSDDIDESLTIDLDSLDIELDEGGRPGPSGADLSTGDEFILEELDDIEPVSKRPAQARQLEDEFDTTIDLDTLDITLDEVEELKKGVDIDDDERLTLEDTGLSIDELGAGESHATTGAHAMDEALPGEEDIKLNLHEIDPSLSVDDLAGERDLRIIDEFEEESLPEIDLEKLQKEEFDDELFAPGPERAPAPALEAASEDYLDLETRQEFSRYRADLEKEGAAAADTVPGGVINFSIDYSLSYSRVGAALRLLGLYAIGLLPRFLVNLLYWAVSAILGFVNTLLVLFRGYPEEDFLEMQENTLRGAVSLAACAFDVVEEMPGFVGRKNIDYALQLAVTYPVRYSRFIAFLRLTGLGIFLALLPHLVLLFLLSLGALLIFFAGLVSVLIFKKWPNVLFDFMARYFNHWVNVNAFMIGLVDRYPSFRFE
ncbi:MAG TPA: zinc-ribbon domain-containing protein [Spirochaetota bacterium]|nr:zinc-ribbon domain-containing protein [Spirochaetota bacterium]HPV96866.1 zinc-ribbon domain-containing protein [Spirochaetota bacterium]